MVTITDEDLEREILHIVQAEKLVSIYELIDRLTERGVDPEKVVSMVYYLAGKLLLHVEVEETERGRVALIKTTPLTQVHLQRTRGSKR
ncbi:MAG: hypothetical protein ACTSYX_10825 [Candidatus Thorarchaeota archaeon]